MGHVESVDIEGFKCLKSVSLECGQFNLITGRNGTGKSSVLEAIELAFQPMALSRQNKQVLGFVNKDAEKADIKIRTENSTQSFSLERPSENTEFRAAMQIEEKLDQIIRDIDISLPEMDLLGIDVEDTSEIDLEIIHTDDYVFKPKESVLPVKYNQKNFYYSLTDKWTNGLCLIEKSTNSSNEMLELSDIPDSLAGPGGGFLEKDVIENLIEETPIKVINPLPQNIENPEVSSITEVRVRDFLREHDIFPNLESFSFDELVFEEDGEQYAIPYDFLGDGTKTIIGIVWQLVADDEIPDVVLLEEPENHLHPGYVKELVPFLIDFAREEDVQLFVTSHNVDFISELLSDSLSEEHREWLAEEFRLIQMTELSPKQFDYDRAKHHTEELHLDLRGL